MSAKDRVDAGHFYGRDGRGRLHETTAQPPDVWICRRLADFPRGECPTGGATATCARCGAVIVYNPMRLVSVPPSTPKVCMQCEHIEPEPLA